MPNPMRVCLRRGVHHSRPEHTTDGEVRTDACGIRTAVPNPRPRTPSRIERITCGLSRVPQTDASVPS
jgi:DNA gyrase inhibitor GyrI